MDIEINSIQYKKILTLKELLILPIDRPELQRDLNLETVQQIINYQTKRFDEKKSFLFIGDLQVVINIDDNTLYLIDGQHRYYAILKNLCELMPEYTISLNFIRISNKEDDIYPSIEDAFILINKYTPIPKYILDCCDGKNINYYKLIIDQFKNYVKREYRQYISESKNPRAPNINLDKMCDKIMSDSIILFQYIKDGVELFDYMKYINKNLWIDFDNEKKGNKVIDRPFYAFVQYTLTKENDWTSSIILINKFKNAAIVSDTTDVVNKIIRKSIPKKIRDDLWIAYCGENYNSLCFVCSDPISVKSFEAGHIIPASEGGSNNIDNLKPICGNCNKSMGVENMIQYKNRYYPLPPPLTPLPVTP